MSEVALAHLLIVHPSGDLRIALRSGPTSLGQDQGCTICLADSQVAPRHCIIQPNEDGSFDLFDLFTPSGTFLNGKRVEASELKSGDQITIGSSRLVFLKSTDSASPLRPPSEPKSKPAILPFADEVEIPERAPIPEPTSVAAVAPSAATHEPEGGIRLQPGVKKGLRDTSFVLTSMIVHLCLMIVLSYFVNEHVAPKTAIPINASLAEFAREGPTEGLIDLATPGEIVADASALDERRARTLGDLPDVDPVATDSSGMKTVGPPSLTEVPYEIGAGAASTGGSEVAGLSGDLPHSGGTEGFRQYARGLRESGLDIVFVIDSTGSMESAIDNVKREVNAMIATLTAFVPGFRLGVVTYRDKKDAYLTRVKELTPNYHEAIHFLDTIEADGGDDIPEAVLAGLKASISGFKWSPTAKRTIILVGDAPPHREDMNEIRQLCSGFTRQRGFVHSLVTPARSSPMRSEVSPDAVETFREIAKKGGGVSLPLAGSNTIVREIMRVAFGPDQAEGAVKSLDDLDSDWRTRHYTKLAATGTPQEIAEALRRDPPPELFFRALVTAARLDLVSTMTLAISDKTLPIETRWAAAVVLTRTTKVRTKDRGLIQAASRLTPDLAPGVLAQRDREFRSIASANHISIALPK